MCHPVTDPQEVVEGAQVVGVEGGVEGTLGLNHINLGPRLTHTLKEMEILRVGMVSETRMIPLRLTFTETRGR